MRIIKDIGYSKIADDYHKIDLYLPDKDCRALLLYLHGGGFVEGSRDLSKMTNFKEDLTGAGIGIASAEYRMYPNAKYPDFIEDAAEATAYAKSELLPLSGCDRLFVCGTSAGAYASMMLCFNDRFLMKHGICAADITGFIHDAGQPTVHFNVLKERGVDPGSRVIDEAAPLYHVKSSDYPPMQIIVSDNDINDRLAQTELLIDRLKSCGYPKDKLTYNLTHGTHVWYTLATDEDGNNEFAKLIIPFINSNI